MPSRVPLTTLLILAAISPDPALAAPTQFAIQPGAMIRTASSWCTAGFVFHLYDPDQGQDALFISTAGHCFPAGGDNNVYDDRNELIGGAAPLNMEDDPTFDFALIEIHPSRYDDVSPAVRHWGGPTELLAPTTQGGTVVRQYGHGTRFKDQELTRHRSGIVTEATAASFGVAIPCAVGDSGAPVVSRTGEALGLIETAALVPLTAPSPICSGSTIAHILERLRLRSSMWRHLQLVTAPLSTELL